MSYATLLFVAVPAEHRMPKHLHEIRDPIHVFVRIDDEERRVVDSRPFQRLRHVHQLGLSFLVYPGATHRRFEHSLGVMELAGRVFDVVTHLDAVTDQLREQLPEISQQKALAYWRQALRMAALCHDLGHLPFSHAAEDLLPSEWSHERLSRAIIECDEMRRIWESITPPLRAVDIVKLALGKRKAKDLSFSVWETILSEIIVGDAFGVDRIDYLLRDSHHMGVAYGRFDHFRLIDTLRILPFRSGGDDANTAEPALGIQDGGLQSAEALALARYFMYTQVYYHQIRRIYDIHLRDFLVEWLPAGKFSTELERHLNTTDNEVTVAMREAAGDSAKKGHAAATRIFGPGRGHFRLLYERHPDDVKKNAEAGSSVFEAARDKFGADHVRHDPRTTKNSAVEFPVQTKDGRIVSSLAKSETLNQVPVAAFDFVFVSPEKRSEAKAWLDKNLDKVIEAPQEDKP
jgi:uncharacterized protein